MEAAPGNRAESSSNRLRVLVTGAGGLLGGRLAALLPSDMEVVAAVHRSAAPAGLATVALDLLDAGSLQRAFDAVRPQAVLHAAALADADRCQREPQLAARINAEAPGVLARLCARRGMRLVALSSDLVFDGTRAWNAEDDLPLPILHYARTKLDGERAVRAEDAGAAIARVALVLGRGHGSRGSASESVAWALRGGRRLGLYTDQYRTPVDAESVARAVALLLRGRQPGVFHLGGPERVSRHQLGLRVAEALGLDASMIDAALSARAAADAPRPADVSLDCGRARRELAYAPRPLDEAIGDGRLRPPVL